MCSQWRLPSARRTLVGGAFLALSVPILLSGCAPAWPFSQPTATVPSRLPDSQQIFQAGQIESDLLGLDPALDNVDADIAGLIFPQLVTLDERQRPVDWAAQRHEVSGNGLTYIFHLRAGMTWADGAPIDANTFAYSINRALDPCTYRFYPYALYAIKGAQTFNFGGCPFGAIKSTKSLIGSSLLAPDPLTLQIILERPAGYFLTALTRSFSWGVPQALVERYTTATPDRYQAIQTPTHTTWTDHLLDSGAFGGNLFTLTTWQSPAEPPGVATPTTPPDVGQGRLVLTRNERFWGQKPLLKEIQYTLNLYKYRYLAWERYAAGKADVGYPDSTAHLEEARSLKDSTFQQFPFPQVDSLFLYSTRAPFDDVRMRNAFALAIDRKAIAHDVYQDTVQPTFHFLPEGLPGYNPNLVDSIGRTGKEALAPDLSTARRLASEYAAEKCGGDFAKCPPVDFYVGRSGRPSPIHQAVLRAWQDAFPGWSISTDDGALEVNYFSLSISQQYVDYPDPQDYISLRWTTNGRNNRDTVRIPEVNALCAQADGMLDLDARIPLYQQAEQLLVNQVAAIPYTQSLITYVVRSRVVGWRVAPTGQTPLSVWQTTYLRR
jgi:oligopeptide transport system substrate-binding protein